MNKPVRLALVGCGWISGAHVRGLGELYRHGCRDVVYAAVCDLAEDTARKQAAEIAAIQGTAPQVFTDLKALIASGIADGADVCLPHYLHHTVGEALLEGGWHVLLEKPLGITIQASRRILAAAKKHGRVLATAENVRRYLAARACAWALNTKRLIGTVTAVHVHVIAHAPFDLQNPAFKWRVVKNLVGGGMIMDSGAHFTDMLLHLFGEVDEVCCTMQTHDRRMVDAPVVGRVPADVEDAWHAVIRFQSGLSATWTYSRAFYGEKIQYGAYYGTDGTIMDNGFPFHCFQGGGQVTLSDGKIISNEQLQIEYLLALAEDEKRRLFPHGCTDGFAVEIWDFADAIRNGRRPEIDGADGLRAKALCEACYESATLGRPVKYADVLNGQVNAYQRPIDDFWKL
jgi:predicted dehydrogenase